jgi:membrane protease YdiL (CAAX protease family)
MNNNSVTLKKSTFYIGIFLSIILPLLAISFPLLFKGSVITFETRFLISRLAQWFALFLLFLFSFKIEKQPFLLWKEQNYSFLKLIKAIISTLLWLIVAMLVTGILLKALGANSESNVLNKTLAVLENNFTLLLLTSISAGIIEELIFRGYMLPRLDILFKNKIFSIAVSSLLFGIMHFSYATLAQTIGPMVFGVVLAIQYYKYKNIKILIICHFLWDLVVLLVKT